MSNDYFKQLELMTKKFDKSLFKGKDLCLVNKIKGALDSAKAPYELVGKVKNNSLVGRLRDYEAITMLTPRINARRTVDTKAYVNALIPQDVAIRSTLGTCFYVDSQKRDAFFINNKKPTINGNTKLVIDFQELYSRE